MEAHTTFTDPERSPQDPQQQLLVALFAQDLTTFCELLRNPKVEPVHKYGPPHWFTCLEIACQHDGCEEFVRALLQAGVKPNVNTTVPEPIHYAASKGHDKTLKVLLWDKRTKVNAVDNFGRTALHLAAKNFGSGEDTERYERCIALLMSCSNIDVNHPNKKGCTAVYEAAYYGGQEAVLAMLRYGSHVLDIDSSNGVGKSAREIIIERYPDLKSILPSPRIEHLHSDLNTQLLAAFQHRQLKIFCDILCQVNEYGNARLNPNFWYSKPYNSTCLEMACKETGCEEFVHALLLAGADPNIVNIITHKPLLHLIAEEGNYEAMKVLLEDKRVNVNMVDECGRTALHIAVEQHEGNYEDTRRQLECISLLLKQNGIDVNRTDKNGRTVAYSAALRNNTEALKLILEQDGLRVDMDISQEPEQKSVAENCESALKEALFQYLYKREIQEFIRTFKKLVNKYATLGVPEFDDGYYTCLQYASNYGLYNVVKVLLEYQADPNATTEYDKRPPVVLTCLRQNQDILKCFLDLPPESNFNINATDARGNTALHYAVQNEDLASVIALLSHGADFKVRNIFDWPPLPAAALGTLLNRSLQTSEHFPDDEDYKLIFNYGLILAHVRQKVGKTASKDESLPLVKNQDQESFKERHQGQALTSEMDLLFHLSQSQEYKNLLTHPIITSFLHLKWFRIRATYYIHLVLYVLFLILLNIYFFMDYGLSDPYSTFKNASMHKVSAETNTSEGKYQETHLERFRTIYGNLTWFLLLFMLFCHTVRELFKFVMSPSKYLFTLDNMLDIVLVFITSIVMFKSWDEDHHRKLFTAFSLFLSWIELALITGRLPKLSINIEMLKSVVRHYTFVFLSYFPFIIAFAVTFYIYHDNEAYNNGTQVFPSLWTAVTNTFMLMTGGFDMLSSNGYSYIMHLLFAFLITIVMFNVLTGIAVSDVQLNRDNTEILQAVSRITLLYEIESTLIYWNTFMEKICKFNCASKMAAYLNNTLRRAILFPNTISSEKNISILPNRNAKIIFHTDENSVTCKMDMKILQAALNIIRNKEKTSELDHMRHRLQQNHNEYLQKFRESSNSIDKIEDTMDENCKKLEKIEENFSLFQNKVEMKHTNLDTNITSLKEQCHLQLAYSQKTLQENLEKYEHRFNWIQQSQKQTIDLLTDILTVLNSGNDKTTFGNTTSAT